MTSIVSTWHENCSLFRFLSSQSAKNYRFFSMEFYEPQKYKIFTFWWGWVGVFCPKSFFQMRNQSSSNLYFCIFEILLLLLWWFVPTFMVIYPCFYDEVVQYRLYPHGYCFEFVSDVDCNIFQPRIQNFQAEKIIVSSRENSMLNTRIHFILYENEVYSGKERSVFL